MPRYTSKESLETFVASVLRAEGVDEWQVQCVADSLVSASLRGVDSHGVRLLTMYVASLRGNSRRRHSPPRAGTELYCM